MKSVLMLIAKEFDKAGIKWALGASMMLYFHGLVEYPNDIDIIIALEDTEKADKILGEIGCKHKKYDSADYSTRFFNEYTVNEVDIDLMAGFCINLPNMVYEYVFDKSSITESYDLDGTIIPLSPVEDWYLLYSLMSGRESKVRVTEDYLISNVVKYPDTLVSSLNMQIPDPIKKKIKKLLK